MLTSDRLKYLLQYDPETGVFTRRIQMNWKSPAGSVAGYVQSNGYRYIGIDRKMYRAGRLAVLYVRDRWPVQEVDHDNLVRDDDRWANLREATSEQNKANTSIRDDNTSGFKGVTWAKDIGKWRARIQVGGKKRSLGCFDSQGEAHLAYRTAAASEFGSFARPA